MVESIYGSGVYRTNNPDWHAADSGWKAERIAAILIRNGRIYNLCRGGMRVGPDPGASRKPYAR
jgi:hypothetical protein